MTTLNIGDTFYEVTTVGFSRKITKVDEAGVTWFRYENPTEFKAVKYSVVGIVTQVVQGETVKTEDVTDYELGTATFYHVRSVSGPEVIFDKYDLSRYIESAQRYFLHLEDVLAKYPGVIIEG
jgi:hypothetical protein